MGWLDAVLGGALALTLFAGYRIGLVARILSWIGLAAGLVVGVVFADDVAVALRDAAPRTRMVGTVAAVLLCAVVGQALGFAVGSILVRRLPLGGPIRLADRVAGAVFGASGVIIGTWLLVPAMASTPGWPASAVRDSVIARVVSDVGPEPPMPIEALRRLLGDAPFPEVFRRLTRLEVGTPPATGLAPFVAASVSTSVARVEGRACDRLQEGSAFVVAPNLLATNAHVVAGETHTQVFFADGRRVDAEVVGFDGARDLALLRADSAALPVLARADANVGTTGAVFGHPGGGPLQESPARVAQRLQADGRDLLARHDVRRDVLVLAASLEPGDSGGPMVDGSGQVVGVAFAVDAADRSIGYALSRGELEAFLSAVLATGAVIPVDTGPCLVG